MSAVTVDLPFPVSVNQMFPTNRKTGRRFISKGYRSWRAQAARVLRMARIKPMQGPVSLLIELTPPDARRRDADNYAKGIIDAIVASGALEDDNAKHITSLKLSWAEPDKLKPGARVTITPAEGPGANILEACTS